MHSLCIPVIYNEVDLSSHDDEGEWPSLYAGVFVCSDNPQRVTYDMDQVLGQKQQAFIDTLIRRPDYAKYIKSFKWTYKTWREVDDHEGEAPMWKAFQAINNVEKVDFASLAYEREIDAPPPLFSSASSIRLSGLASYAMVRSVLHSVDPSRIVSLDLNNLQDFGQIEEGEDLPSMRDLSTMTESEYADGTPKLRHPGPLRGHLRHMNGKCTNLKNLCLRSVGQDYAPLPMWSAQKDEERYAEWAAFIGSVKTTLETLLFQQDSQAEDPTPNPCGTIVNRLPMQRKGRPMDQRFMNHILPVLITGPWPVLQSVIIQGIGGSVRQYYSRKHIDEVPNRVETAYSLLRMAFPSHVSVTCEKRAGMSFFHRSQGNSYDS
ncbi:MAG: hypothetical protein M1827_004872 [Pycnora praestabilis]|nr:MAG: hypothetical protein M1827_004872 [Pycnora praestabilis]